MRSTLHLERGHTFFDRMARHGHPPLNRAANFGSSLLHVGRSGGYASPPITEQVHSAIEVGRGNGGPWKARKTESRFSLPFPRPWKSP